MPLCKHILTFFGERSYIRLLHLMEYIYSSLIINNEIFFIMDDFVMLQRLEEGS